MHKNEPSPVPSPEVRRRAQRHLYILYAVMIVMLVLPFILLKLFGGK